MEVLNTNLDLQPSIVNLEYLSRDGEWIMDSCKKDSSWWHEAIRYADHVESLGNAPQFSKLVSTRFPYFVNDHLDYSILLILKSFTFHFYLSFSVYLLVVYWPSI